MKSSDSFSVADFFGYAKIAFIVLITTLVMVGLFAIYGAIWGSRAINPETVLTVLRSENLDFLVRRRQVTQLVLTQVEENSVWDWVPLVGDYRALTKEDGVLTANVRIYYGFDLDKAHVSTSTKDPASIAIRLPEPEMLDYSPDLDSLKFVALRTGIATSISKIFKDETLRDKLVKQIKPAVEKFVATPGALPTKDEMLGEMSGFEKLLTDAFGKPIVFE